MAPILFRNGARKNKLFTANDKAGGMVRLEFGKTGAMTVNRVGKSSMETGPVTSPRMPRGKGTLSTWCRRPDILDAQEEGQKPCFRIADRGRP